MHLTPSAWPKVSQLADKLWQQIKRDAAIAASVAARLDLNSVGDSQRDLLNVNPIPAGLSAPANLSIKSS